MNSSDQKNFSYFDFLPIIISTIYASRTGGDFDAWRRAFLIGAGLAVAQLIFYRHWKREVDPYALGTNVFLAFGALCFQFRINELLVVYDDLREALSFIFVGLVGIAYLFLKPEGLLNQPGRFVKRYSGVLLVLIGISAVISYQFKGDQLFSVTLPYLGLFYARSYLNKRAEKHISMLRRAL